MMQKDTGSHGPRPPESAAGSRLRPRQPGDEDVRRWVFVAIAALAGLGFWAWRKSLDVMPPVKIPAAPIAPAPNGYDVFRAASDRITVRWKPTNRRPSRDWLTRAPFSEELRLVQNAPVANAAGLRLLRSGLKLSTLAPENTSLWDLDTPDPRLRYLASGGEATAQVELAKGEVASSVETALDVVTMGQRIQPGSSVIACRTGIICENIGRLPLWRAAQLADSVTARDAARRLLAADAGDPTFAESLSCEEQITQCNLLRVLARNDWRRHMLDPVAALMLSKRQIYDGYTRAIDGTVGQVRGPYRRNLHAPKSPLLIVNYLIDGEYQDEWTGFLTNSASMRLLAITFALRAYRLDTGKLPPSLTDLVPAYLPQVPRDPFSTGPLRYRPSGSTYVLYSVGPDGHDDGGKPIDNGVRYQNRYRVWSTSPGDIVAGINE